MSDTELIIILETISGWARNSGCTDVEQYFYSLAAKVAELQFKKHSFLDVEAVWLFQLNGPQFYKVLKEEIDKIPQANKPKVFSDVSGAINAAQERGIISIDQANLARRVVSQVEEELKETPPEESDGQEDKPV